MTFAAAGTMAMFPSEGAELDADTLEGCRAGEPAAVRRFITRYEGLVFAFLSRALGRGPHVEDLAQEVFLRACRSLPRFEASGTARVSTWLLTIASHLAIDTRRKRQIPVAPLDADTLTPSADTPETERRRLEIGRALETAAAQLPADQRDAFILAEFHGMSTRDLAAVLGVPENTAKTRLFRARAQLRLLLKDVWEDNS